MKDAVNVNMREATELLELRHCDSLKLGKEVRLEIASWLMQKCIGVDGYTTTYQSAVTGRLMEFSDQNECAAFIAARLGDLLLNKKYDHLKFLLKELVVEQKGGYSIYKCCDWSISSAKSAAGKEVVADMILDELKEQIAFEAHSMIRRMESILSVL